MAASLRRLRSKINAWFLVEGFSRFLLCLLTIIVLDVVVDWRFNLDRAQRIAMLVIGIIPLVLVSYRYLLAPWLSPLTDDALCLELEQRNRQLGESLISALQLSRAEGPEVGHASATMIDATIQQGNAGARGIAFDDLLNRSRLLLNGILLAISAVLLIGGGVSVIATEPMRTWFQRNLLLRDKAWANHTFFEFAGLIDGELAVPLGSNWPLVVGMVDDQTEMPYALDVDLRIAGRDRTERADRYEQNREFRVNLRRVTDLQAVRARSGRSRTDWYPVRLVARPSTERLTLEVVPPPYSGLPAQRLVEGEGPFYVLKGSRMLVRGVASKPIASASLVVGETPHPMKITGGSQFTLELDSQSLTASTYRVVLEDYELVWNPGSRTPTPLRSQDDLEFTLKYSPDLAPSVTARLEGVSSIVLPVARVPYLCSVNDDFGIVAARLRFEWREDTAGSRANTGHSELAMPAGGDTKKYSFEDAVNLADFNIPVGSGFSFEIEADDNDVVSGPKTGKSTKFLLRVVSEEELRANLLRREKELRQEFESVLKRQDEVLTDSEALRAGLRGADQVSSGHRKSLMNSQRTEKLLTTDVVSIAHRLSAIIVETQNNRIEAAGGPIERRLGSQIIVPMRRLGDDTLPQIAQRLDRVRRQLDRESERDMALEDAINGQRQAITAMQEILRFMKKSEGFQEAVNLLHQVQQEQRKVAELTDGEKRNRLERILDQTKSEPSVP